MTTPPTGHFDGFGDGRLHGWAWDPSRPQARVTVDVFDGPALLLSARADRFRPDLAALGYGDGTYGFSIGLPLALLERPSLNLSLRCREPEFELINSPLLHVKPVFDEDGRAFHTPPLSIDVHNIKKLDSWPGQWRFRYLLLDPIDFCNADCVYCPYLRSGKKLDVELVRDFFENHAARIDLLQIGCGQEPTTHLGLIDFFEMANSLNRKPDEIRLVTNGMLLNRHDIPRMATLGLKKIQVSIDSANPEIQRKQRPGTDLDRILSNLKTIREEAPSVEISFTSVVTAHSIDFVHGLVELGLRIGIERFRFREVTERADSQTRKPDFHEAFGDLTLKPEEFQRLSERLPELYPGVSLSFLDSDGYRRTAPVRGLGQ